MEQPTAPVRYSWIARDATERARTMALHARFERMNRYVLALVAVCMTPAVFVVDDPVLVVGLAVLGFGQYGLIQTAAPGFQRPEVWVFWALIAAQAFMGLAVVLSGLAPYGALGLLVWPASGLASRFPNRVVIVGTAISIGLLVAGFAVGAPQVMQETPVIVSGFIAITVAIVANVSVLRLSDIAHHSAATFDELTGLPNRVALRARAEALEAQPPHGTALVLLDIDHFKRINDEHGHQAGDHVLTAFGAMLRETVRGDDLAYRIGGEEFAIVVPGLDLEGAADLAQRVLHAARRTPLAGHPVTSSAGVAVAAPGEKLSWKRLFAQADAALYRAKEEGRDRVRWAAPATRDPAVA